MVELRIGAGGWAYFQVPGKDSLKAYSSIFDFVEVNSTYYEYPNPKMVSSWRTRVPEDFEFAVRCHKDLVRGFDSQHRKSLPEILENMERTCGTLNASILAILVPEKIKLTDTELASGLETSLSTFRSKGTRVAVELRGRASPGVLRVMESHDAVHSVDLSKDEPAYESNLVYSRLFGKGVDNIYEFDDKELQDISSKASRPKFEKSILAFHGVRMYRDAGRLKSSLKSGVFPQITGQTGLESVRQVLLEDASFPATKAELVSRQGWKLFDLDLDRKVRVAAALEKIEQRTYASVDDVLASLEGRFPADGPFEKLKWLGRVQ